MTARGIDGGRARPERGRLSCFTPVWGILADLEVANTGGRITFLRMISIRSAVCVGLLLAASAPAAPATPAAPEALAIRSSVVKIESTAVEPDYRIPWNPGRVGGGSGTGFIISGNRVMTNAHVVRNSRFLSLSKDGAPQSYRARVQHIAHDADLAVLEVEDPAFFEGVAPLEFGGVPELESTVSVYGFPIGGGRLSVTRGVVSRVDFQTYSHSGADAHLAIQIDAAINPGNSGGPVMQDGKVVGVAFQGYRGDVAQNTGYMIPTPVIHRFLSDIEDGKYDRYMDLAANYFPLQNPAMREALGLDSDSVGVMVGDVFGGGSAEGYLEPGDVLLTIDGLPIDSAGSVELEGEIVPLAEVVERKQKGDQVDLEILRDQEPMQISIPLDQPWPFQLSANRYDVKPRYAIFGGLVFQPVDQNFMRSHSPGNLRLRHLFNFYVTEHVYKDHPELITLSEVLADPANAYAQKFKYEVVDKINDVDIKTLEDVTTAFEKPVDYHVIEFLGQGRPVVLDAQELKEAEPRIRQRYQVAQPVNLEE